MLKNYKVTFASAGIALGLTALAAISPQAQAATLNTGTTIGAAIWNRPIIGNPPTALSAVGTAVPYSAFGFTVSDPGSYTFQSTATSPTNWDNFTVLYQKTFNPANPLINAVISNDDNPTIGLSGFTIALDPSTNYFLVTTGFGNGDFGAFTNTITGVGTATAIATTAVPEPATILGTLTAVGYGVYSRRKIKLAGSIDKKTV
jgi:hypothetical protein